MNATKPRILVSLPCYGHQLYDIFLISWTKTLVWGFDNGIEFKLQTIGNESLLPRARNQGIAKLLDEQARFTHILFIDADMGWGVHNLERLLQADKEMIGCPGPTKWIHWELAHKAILNGKDPETFTLRYAINFIDPNVQVQNGYANVRDMGCCFFLVKKEAVLKMTEAYAELRTSNMGWVNGGENESKNNYALFDTTISREEENRYLECDHAFMARWRAIGGEVWADLTSDLSHAGTHIFEGNMADYYLNSQFQGKPIPAVTSVYGNLPPDPKDCLEEMLP